MTLLKDIVTYLASLGLVAGDGIDAYRDFMPNEPDNIISIYEYKGDPFSPYTEIVHRSVQVVVRDAHASKALLRATAICKAFSTSDETRRIDLTPTRWAQVYVRDMPHKIKQDDKGRIHYGFNLGISTQLK